MTSTECRNINRTISEDKSKSRSTSVIKTITERIQGKGISVFETLQRQTLPTGESYKSESATRTEETSKSCHMRSGSHPEKKNAGDANPNDSDDTASGITNCNSKAMMVTADDGLSPICLVHAHGTC